MLRFLLVVLAVFAGGVYSGEQCFTNEACAPPDEFGAIRCEGDCACGDSMADECERPHPTTGLHVASISDCMANCEIYHLEGRCNFIIYHYDNIDENCIIMPGKFSDYIGHCNVRGQALWGTTPGAGLSRWKGCCDNTCCHENDNGNKCTSCTDCNADPCRGFMLSDCQVNSDFQETTTLLSWDTCESWARLQLNGSYVLYHKEESACEEYGGTYGNKYHGFSRDCNQAIVELGTDPVKCPYHPDPTPDSTTSAPICVVDEDCDYGEICPVNHICRQGCRTIDGCEPPTHPCHCKNSCNDPNECQYCDISVSKDGVCRPGCSTNADCSGGTCNGQNLCVRDGEMVLESLTFTTAKCDGCAGTNIETGASVWMKGYLDSSCIIDNLDHKDRVDYQDNISQTFTSAANELGACSLANLQGYTLKLFNVIWNGQGSWTPREFLVSFTGTDVTTNCPYKGPNALETGDSATIDCFLPPIA